MASLIIHAGQLRKFDEETAAWHDWYFLLRPAYLESHMVGQPLLDEPPCMPLAFAWVGARLYQPRRDMVMIALQFRDTPKGPIEEWCLAAAILSHS